MDILNTHSIALLATPPVLENWDSKILLLYLYTVNQEFFRQISPRHLFLGLWAKCGYFVIVEIGIPLNG
jgi:hypothetical protein